MTIRDLKKEIENLPNTAEFLVSNDEELNCLFTKWEICKLSDMKKSTFCIFGYSGTELELDEM